MASLSCNSGAKTEASSARGHHHDSVWRGSVPTPPQSSQRTWYGGLGEPDSHGAAMLHRTYGGDPVPPHLQRARAAAFADVAGRAGARLPRGGLPLAAPPAEEPPHAHTDQGGGGDHPVRPVEQPADVVQVLAEQVAERHHRG